jgi:hypothetical protein
LWYWVVGNWYRVYYLLPNTYYQIPNTQYQTPNTHLLKCPSLGIVGVSFLGNLNAVFTCHQLGWMV